MPHGRFTTALYGGWPWPRPDPDRGKITGNVSYQDQNLLKIPYYFANPKGQLHDRCDSRKGDSTEVRLRMTPSALFIPCVQSVLYPYRHSTVCTGMDTVWIVCSCPFNVKASRAKGASTWCNLTSAKHEKPGMAEV
jgi:hypothetical protein